MDERISWALAVIFFLLIILGIGVASRLLSISRPFEAPNMSFLVPAAESAVSAPPGRTATFVLKEIGNSGEFGQVVVRELGGGKSAVDLMVDGTRPGVVQPASLNLGKCPRVGEKKFDLNPVANGRSQTILDANYENLVGFMPFAATVRRSLENKNLVSCGEVREPLLVGAR